jgi:hypothetical protein
LENLLTPMPGKSYLIGVGRPGQQGAAGGGIGATDLVHDFLRQVRGAAASSDATQSDQRDQPGQTHEAR